VSVGIFFSVGWRGKFVLSKYEEGSAEQHLLSYCYVINNQRETPFSRDLSSGISPDCLLCSDFNLYCDLSFRDDLFHELYVKNRSCRIDPGLINKMSRFSIIFYLRRKAIGKAVFATDFLCRTDLRLLFINHKFEKI